MKKILLFIIILLILLLFLIIKTNAQGALINRLFLENFENSNLIERPLSLSIIRYDNNSSTNIPTNNPNTSNGNLQVINGNIVDYPTFFCVTEKWTGCLPRPLYQGSCGSCWAFAVVTSISSRFYIESCGLSGCRNYPQINFGSMNNVNYNINNVYKFRKLYLTDVFTEIDKSLDGYISFDEWSNTLNGYQKIFSVQTSSYSERHRIAQIMVYLLNFQSLGSIDLTNKQKVNIRIKDSFDIWIELLTNLTDSQKQLDQYKSNNLSQVNTQSAFNPPINTQGALINQIDINLLKTYWLNEPITLSAEKLISCCNDCVSFDYMTKTYNDLGSSSSSSKPDRNTGNPACMGLTLKEAWSMLLDSGTPTADCIGYNLDSWTEGSYTPTCKEVQGPIYSFCTGYVIDKSNFQLGDYNGNKSVKWAQEVDKYISDAENSGIDPVAIPVTDNYVPWVDPQLFRFKAKNVYKVHPNAIEKEIMERGPVTATFVLYSDFQNDFGVNGGIDYIEGSGGNNDVIGGSSKNIIYKASVDPSNKVLGAHSITIVGWGTYKGYEYWICMNSWGTKWGHGGIAPYGNRDQLPKKGSGFFWMSRGINNCDIENNVYAGQPDIDNITYMGVADKYGWKLLPPSSTDVDYIPQQTDPTTINNNIIKYNKLQNGGGIFTYKENNNNNTIWSTESMQPPSPFVLFWDKDRPIYKIGLLLSDTDENNTTFLVDSDTISKLQKITVVQKNPLLVIDDEQLQFLNFVSGKNAISVSRGVNNSILMKHTKNASIYVIPYKTLSVNFLESNK